MSQRELRTGYSTGSCATGAIKAALLMLLEQREYTNIEILTLNGIELNLKVNDIKITPDHASCSIIKDAGDDPDITNGCKVFAKVSLNTNGKINFFIGEGIGIVTKAGLPVEPGNPAINPGPLKMIRNNIQNFLPSGNGIDVTLWIPGGQQLAEKTLNPSLGIIGGISILGTTGIVYPMSEEAYKTSLVPQLKVVKAIGYDSVVLTPGRIGQRALGLLGFNEDIVVQTSNFIGYMLENAQKIGFKKIFLAGHPGKIAKISAGVFHTHNRVGDARMEAIAAVAGALGAKQETVINILDAPTTDMAIEIVNQDEELVNFWHVLAQRAAIRCEKYLFKKCQVEILITTSEGIPLGWSERAQILGGELGWQK